MPEFSPGEAKVAIAPITAKPAGMDCEAELFLGPDELTKVASSVRVPFVSTGSAQSVRLPIAMPSDEGAYHGYIDVFTEGFRFLAYKTKEDIEVKAPVAPLSYGPLSVAIVSYPPAPGWKTPIVHCDVSNPTSSVLNPTIKVKLYERYYYPGYGMVEQWRESPGQTLEIPAGGNIDYIYDGTEISSPILIESGGGQLIISWELWLEDNHGGRSEVYEFKT